MKECTNPQYIVSQNSGDIHTEYFSVEPGSNPVIVNQIPAGKPTISGLGAEETIRALAKLLSDNGYCKMPEVVDAPESTIVQVTNSEVEEQTAIEEVPVDPSIPLVYTQKTENIDVGSGGIVAGVVAIPALIWGGQQLVSRIQNRMFTNDVNPIVINNYEDQIPENIYTPTKSTVAVSAAPVHEPSPWASTLAHTGTPYQTSDFGRNESTKSTRNDFEMTSEMENISDEMSQRISQVKTRLSNIFQNPESIGIQPVSDEINSDFGYYDPNSDLTEAKNRYFELRGHGISKAVDLGGSIFGIRGGEKWSIISPILQSWANEWEAMNG